MKYPIAPKKLLRFEKLFWVRCGARTHDTQNHNLVLYQLN